METLKNKSLLGQIEEELYSRVSHLPEGEQQQAIAQILINDYKIPRERIESILSGEKKSKKMGKGWLYVIPIILTTLGAGLFIKGSEKDNPKEKIPPQTEVPDKDTVKKQPEEQKELKSIPPNVEKKKEERKIEPVNERWNQELYKSLPKYGRDVYKEYAENNPSIGRGYGFLDKKSATEYLFDRNNNLIAKIVSGFGEDKGDEANTAFQYGNGKMTTPAGGYIMSEYANEKDIQTYGPLQFSLLGITILGNKILLGLHQRYTGRGQGPIREAKDATPTPDDNDYTNGCINNDPEDFKKFLKPYFLGDGKEIFFVLPDDVSEKSGVKFDVKKLIKELKPIIKEMELKRKIEMNSN